MITTKNWRTRPLPNGTYSEIIDGIVVFYRYCPKCNKRINHKSRDCVRQCYFEKRTCLACRPQNILNLKTPKPKKLKKVKPKQPKQLKLPFKGFVKKQKIKKRYRCEQCNNFIDGDSIKVNKYIFVRINVEMNIRLICII